MERILTYLRDPIWQAIGVAVTVIGIFISSAISSKQLDELSIVHIDKVNLQATPQSPIKLVLKTTDQEIVTGVVDFYSIVNKSSRPILASDFTAPLTLSKGPYSRNIFSVVPCEPNSSSPYDRKNHTTVELTWIQSGDKWVASPALLNPNDETCVLVLSEEADPLAKFTGNGDRLKWDGRIVNVKVRAHESVKALLASEGGWMEPLKTVVFLRDFGAYWFVVLQIVLFFATVTLASQAGWISSYATRDVLKLAFVGLLSIGTAEVLTDIFINSNQSGLHFLAWIILAGHAAFAVGMTVAAKRRRNSLIPVILHM